MVSIAAKLSEHKVLVVDDEADNLELLKVTLEFMHGSEVCIASSSQEALAQLASFQPTLIISDIAMPQEDGFSLLRSLRSHPKTQDLPIIALTAHAMESDRQRILAAGFDSYMSKPFHVPSIGRQVEMFLRNFIDTHRPRSNEVIEVATVPPQTQSSQTVITL